MVKKRVGKWHTAEELANPFQHVLKIKRKMDCCAILSAKKVTQVLDQSVGKDAQKTGETMELSAKNHMHMEEEQVNSRRKNVKKFMMILVRKMVHFGIRSAVKIFIMLVAAFVVPIAQMI